MAPPPVLGRRGRYYSLVPLYCCSRIILRTRYGTESAQTIVSCGVAILCGRIYKARHLDRGRRVHVVHTVVRHKNTIKCVQLVVVLRSLSYPEIMVSFIQPKPIFSNRPRLSPVTARGYTALGRELRINVQSILRSQRSSFSTHYTWEGEVEPTPSQ